MAFITAEELREAVAEIADWPEAPRDIQEYALVAVTAGAGSVPNDLVCSTRPDSFLMLGAGDRVMYVSPLVREGGGTYDDGHVSRPEAWVFRAAWSVEHRIVFIWIL